MARLSAHCSHCGASFESRGFRSSNSIGTVMVGNKESCPNCGQIADVQEGIFDTDADGHIIGRVKALSAAERQALRALLEEVREHPDRLEELIEGQATASTDMKAVLAEVRKATIENRVLFLIALILNVLTGSTAAAPPVQPAPIAHVDRPPPAAHGGFRVEPEKRVGRNYLCPCESGKKFKYCHDPRRQELPRRGDESPRS